MFSNSKSNRKNKRNLFSSSLPFVLLFSPDPCSQNFNNCQKKKVHQKIFCSFFGVIFFFVFCRSSSYLFVAEKSKPHKSISFKIKTSAPTTKKKTVQPQAPTPLQPLKKKERKKCTRLFNTLRNSNPNNSPHRKEGPR